jgi:hypothetical protein
MSAEDWPHHATPEEVEAYNLGRSSMINRNAQLVHALTQIATMSKQPSVAGHLHVMDIARRTLNIEIA